MADSDSIWHYFEKLSNEFVKYKQNNCKWLQKQNKSKSTTNMIRHLKNHPQIYELWIKAKEYKEKQKEKDLSLIPKITNFTVNIASTSNSSSNTNEIQVLKRSRVTSGEQASIVESFS